MTDSHLFRFRNLDELLSAASLLGLSLPHRSDITPLFQPLILGSHTVPNRLVVQPMEIYDGHPDGSPSEWTVRRYHRYASGGSGLIWFEATSVSSTGKSNPRQLWLHAGNIKKFASLIRLVRETAMRQHGKRHRPYLVLQLTHSGRYSNPGGSPTPVTSCRHPVFDMDKTDGRIITDAELEILADQYVDACKLAWQAGFDAVDIKACHGYLAHELLFSRSRHNSRFGGQSYSRRTNWLKRMYDIIREEVPVIDLCSRINIFDGLPEGWGVSAGNPSIADPEEPMKLIRQLRLKGCNVVNITAGIPRINPWLGRPFNKPLPGSPPPPEHPLEGIYRLIALTGEVQKGIPDMAVVGSAYSWLRHLFPYIASGVISEGLATFIGLGRMSFAYPDAAGDLIKTGRLDPRKCCICCSACSDLMRHSMMTGCVVRDKSTYSRVYRKMKNTS